MYYILPISFVAMVTPVICTYTSPCGVKVPPNSIETGKEKEPLPASET